MQVSSYTNCSDCCLLTLYYKNNYCLLKCIPVSYIYIYSIIYLQVHTTDYPGNYPGYDDSWDLEKFKKVCEMRKMSFIKMNVVAAKSHFFFTWLTKMCNFILVEFQDRYSSIGWEHVGVWYDWNRRCHRQCVSPYITGGGRFDVLSVVFACIHVKLPSSWAVFLNGI